MSIHFTPSESPSATKGETVVEPSFCIKGGSYIALGNYSAAVHFTADETRDIIAALQATLPAEEPTTEPEPAPFTFRKGDRVLVEEGARSAGLAVVHRASSGRTPVVHYDTGEFAYVLPKYLSLAVARPTAEPEPEAPSLLEGIAADVARIAAALEPKPVNLVPVDAEAPEPVVEEVAPAPVFEVGDLVRVAGTSWDGVGRLESLWDDDEARRVPFPYYVRLLTGEDAGELRPCAARELSTPEPLTEAPEVGDKLVVIDNAGAPRAYEAGEVVEVTGIRGPISGRHLVVCAGRHAGMYPHRFTRA